MKPLVTVLLLVVVLCLVGANGRHVDGNEYDELSDGEEQSELINRMKDHASQMRHRRRSRQMFAYDYPPPYYYPDRRDSRHQEDLTQIIKSLEEIIVYMRRPPPPPPQPVYIPYPVVQYRPCVCRSVCRRTGSKNETTPSTGVRIAGVDDDNRIWIGTPDVISPEEYDESNDGSRPVSLDTKPAKMPALPVASSREEATIQNQTEAPAPARPGPCETAILDCCGLSSKPERSSCFARYNCSHIYATNRACDPDVIKQILEMFRKAYAPVNDI